jgi:hypothetical protein
VRTSTQGGLNGRLHAGTHRRIQSLLDPTPFLEGIPNGRIDPADGKDFPLLYRR